MFILSKYDVLGLYGEKFLFMPKLKAEMESQEVILPEIKTKETEIVSNKISQQITLNEEDKHKKNTLNQLANNKIQDNITEKNKMNNIEKAEKIQWKIRAKVSCKLIVIVAEQEFKNAVLMGALLFILEEKCKINRVNVSFGVFQDGQKTFDFSDMPVSTGVLFSDFELEKPIVPNKNIYILPSMATIALNPNEQETCINLFKSL